jgi:hypothetical protein
MLTIIKMEQNTHTRSANNAARERISREWEMRVFAPWAFRVVRPRRAAARVSAYNPANLFVECHAGCPAERRF